MTRSQARTSTAQLAKDPTHIEYTATSQVVPNLQQHMQMILQNMERINRQIQTLMQLVAAQRVARKATLVKLMAPPLVAPVVATK